MRVKRLTGKQAETLRQIRKRAYELLRGIDEMKGPLALGCNHGNGEMDMTMEDDCPMCRLFRVLFLGEEVMELFCLRLDFYLERGPFPEEPKKDSLHSEGL